jgi:VWA domain-containing protein/aerotolerance regulator-like protein
VTFSQPSALLLLGLALPLVLLYALRGNPRRRATSAAFLWRGLEQRLTAHRRWQRPPASLALLLELLALAAGSLVLAGPSCGGRPVRQQVFVLDASASMQATDDSPSRFEAARVEIGRRLAALADGDRAALIRMGERAEVLASGGRAEVERALARARAGSARPDLREALARAGELIQRPTGEGSSIVVFSDGTVNVPPELTALTVPVQFVRVGSRGSNQGVSALATRRSPGEGGRLGGFARVTNYAEQAIRLPVRIEADGSLLETRLVDLPARGRSELPFDLPNEARVVSVTLAGHDDLALDDRAEVVVGDNAHRTAQVVSRTPAPWEQAFGALPNVTTTVQAPSAYQDSGADLVVLDGYLPDPLPGGQLLIVNPPAGNRTIGVLGETAGTSPSSFDVHHPLLRSLDPGGLHLSQAERLAAPGWASTIVDSPAGPLLLAGELAGRRIVVFGFNPFASQLEKMVTFPILVANAVDYLAPAGLDPFVAPEQRVTLPVRPDAREVVLLRPDGTRSTLPVRAGAVSIDATDLVGRYLVRQRLASGDQIPRSFSVDLFGEAEADTLPRDLPSLAALPTDSSSATPFLPLPWPPLVALTLGLLTVEWLHFVRRG